MNKINQRDGIMTRAEDRCLTDCTTQMSLEFTWYTGTDECEGDQAREPSSVTEGECSEDRLAYWFEPENCWPCYGFMSFLKRKQRRNGPKVLSGEEEISALILRYRTCERLKIHSWLWWLWGCALQTWVQGGSLTKGPCCWLWHLGHASHVLPPTAREAGMLRHDGSRETWVHFDGCFCLRNSWKRSSILGWPYLTA